MLSDDGLGGPGEYRTMDYGSFASFVPEYNAADPGSGLQIHILTGNWDPGYCSAGHNMDIKYKLQNTK